MTLSFCAMIGIGCRVAGFFTVYSSQLSVFTLTLITLERRNAIKYAIYMNMRLKMGFSLKVMIFGHIYAVAMATLPIFGVSSYSKTSVCLPMEVQHLGAWIFLMSLLIINALAIFIIAYSYITVCIFLCSFTEQRDA